MSRVVIVEGERDRSALGTLAKRRGRDLRAEGTEVVAIGGAHAIRRFLENHHDKSKKFVGLVDSKQADVFTRLGVEVYVCESDLEDELIRALGLDGVEKVIEAQGELRSLRALQRQPAQRDRTTLQHIRRFMSSKSGRKALYARLLVEALDLDAVPQPRDRVLNHV